MMSKFGRTVLHLESQLLESGEQTREICVERSETAEGTT
jgi:hypothetical protein